MPTDPTTDELSELRAEVARLQAQLDHAQAAPGPATSGIRRPLVRTVVSAVLIVLACILAPLSAAAVWARGEVTDTDRYVQTVAPLASDPAVQAAVANRITTEVFSYIDVTGLANEAVTTVTDNRQLTPQQSAALTALSGAMVNGLESFTGDQVTRVVESQQFANAWTEANTVAHQQIVALLSGTGDGALAVQGNAVTLNLGDVVAQVKAALVDQGFTVAEKIPAVDTTVTVFQSDDIATIQTAYNALDTLGYWLPFIAAGLAIAGVFVANERRVAVLGIGSGLVAASLLAALGLALARQAYLAALPPEVNVAAATAFYDTVLNFLKQTIAAGVAAGVVLAGGAVLTGGSRLAVGIRRMFRHAAAAVQRLLASWGAQLSGVRGWVGGQAKGLRVGATVVALAVVLSQRYKTPELIVWATAGLLVALFVIQVLASEDEPVTAAP